MNLLVNNIYYFKKKNPTTPHYFIGRGDQR